jgi:hypothetical protein
VFPFHSIVCCHKRPYIRLRLKVLEAVLLVLESPGMTPLELGNIYRLLEEDGASIFRLFFFILDNIAALRLLNELSQSALFSPLFLICHFVFINNILYTVLQSFCFQSLTLPCLFETSVSLFHSSRPYVLKDLNPPCIPAVHNHLRISLESVMLHIVEIP